MSNTDNSLAVAVMGRLTNDPAGLSLAALAEQTGIDRASISRVAQRCVARGLLRWTRSPVDRRIILYALTEAGREELGKVVT